ncbi:MAG: dnaB, partial [Neobacillus sp.]|nr:dnaB [Neobacillus sp.]
VQRITKAIGIYSQMNIKIHDESSQTVLSIRSVIRKAMRDNPNQRHLLIIDYLGYVKALGKFDRSDQEIGSITKGLKQIARKYNIPVLLLCQLSRGVEQRQDKRPMMSDLRDSGNIEQDADVIMFLYRDEYYNRQTDKQNIAEVIVSKQRNGPTGTIELAFLKEYGKFCDLERRAVLQ